MEKGQHTGQGHTHKLKYQMQVALTTLCKYKLNTSTSSDLISCGSEKSCSRWCQQESQGQGHKVNVKNICKSLNQEICRKKSCMNTVTCTDQKLKAMLVCRQMYSSKGRPETMHSHSFHLGHKKSSPKSRTMPADYDDNNNDIKGITIPQPLKKRCY